MRLHTSFFTVVPLAAGLVMIGASLGVAAREHASVIEEKRLVVVGQGDVAAPLAVRVGEVVAFQPFALPVAPGFLKVRLKAKLDGDRVLEQIGQVNVSSAKEGRVAPSLFFLVREPGRTSVKLSAVEHGKQVSERYFVSYVVEAQLSWPRHHNDAAANVESPLFLKSEREVRAYLRAVGLGALLILIAATASTGSAQLNAAPGMLPEALTRLGYATSNKHESLIAASINLANSLLSLDSKYQLALGATAPGKIPVYLISAGDARQAAGVPVGERFVLVNADRIAEEVRRFKIEYDDSEQLDDSEPPAGVFPKKHDQARKLWAMILMHEVGHVWIDDHGPYSGTPVQAYDEIVKLAGPEKLDELQADKFCADHLRKANALLLNIENKGDVVGDVLDQTIAAHRLESPDQIRETIDREMRLYGRQMRAAVEFETFLYQCAMRIDLKGYLAGRPIVPTHLDLDLRVAFLFEVAYGKPDAEAFAKFPMQDRADELAYRVARDEAISAAGGREEASHAQAGDRYFLDRILLRHKDVRVRRRAAVVIREKEPHTPDILPNLIAALRREYGGNPGITHTLSSMGRVAVPELIDSLEHPDPAVRGDAALSLLRMRSADNVAAVNALLEAAKDEDAYVREKAILALEGHGYDPSTLEKKVDKGN